MLQVGSDKQRVLNVGLGIELSVFDEELAYAVSGPRARYVNAYLFLGPQSYVLSGVSQIEKGAVLS